MAVILLGGRPGLSPLDLSPFIYWDFTDTTKLWKDTGRTDPVTASGDSVKGVTDQGSNLNHLSEATNPPIYTTAASPSPSGYGCLEFDNTNDKLTGANAYTRFTGRAGAYTVMGVYLCKSSAAEGGGYTPGKSLFWQGTYAIGSSTTTVNPNYQCHDTTSANACVARKACTLNEWVLGTHMAVGDGAADPNWNPTSYCGINDTRDASLTSATVAGSNFANSSNAPIVGLRTVAWNGYVAEIAVWQSQLAEASRQEVERFWAWKYGITLPY